MSDKHPSTGDRLVLGLDVSTQSLTATLISAGPGGFEVLEEHSIPYARDERTRDLGFDPNTLILPPGEPGQAEQPAVLFLAALDAFFQDMVTKNAPLNRIEAIQISAQQHGHAYLNSQAETLFSQLSTGTYPAHGSPEPLRPSDKAEPLGLSNRAELPGASGTHQPQAPPNLATLLEHAFSYPGCPIWMSSNTSQEAEEIRSKAGGKDGVIRLSGSDSPLRFTGAVIRRIAKTKPEVYAQTTAIRLLNSLIAGVLTGKTDVPADWGNASGMTLMDYQKATWSPVLLEAAAGDLPGGAQGLGKRLGALAHPLTWAGTIAGYFTQRYGLSEECLVGIGSGDNPQSKVGVQGDLLSLGTSFVYMIHQDSPKTDSQGFANSMYDGLGQPFVFACRTNGALVWDQVRRAGGMGDQDYAAAEKVLAASDPRDQTFVFQPLGESFPPSPVLGSIDGTVTRDYPGVVDSSLALLWYYSRHLSQPQSQLQTQSQSPLAITGGPSGSLEICRRVASLWRRPVIRVAGSGASLGAALAAYAGLALDIQGDLNASASELAAGVLAPLLGSTAEAIQPDPRLVESYHGGDASYITSLIKEFEDLL
jgi:xylulokinase